MPTVYNPDGKNESQIDKAFDLHEFESAIAAAWHRWQHRHDATETQEPTPEPAAGNAPTVHNPSREVRYARQASADACAFCQMLAIRPYAQYESEEAAVGPPGEPYHPGCDCEAVAIAPGDTLQMPGYAEQWVADYSAARDDLDVPGDVASVEDILNHMRRAQYARDHPKQEEEPTAAEEAPTRRAASIMTDVITKSVEAQVRPVESDDPNGEFEVVLSTERLDRDGENLWVDEWKQPLPGRIHIDSDHGMSIEKTVGSAVPRLDGNQMVGHGSYASTPHAQMVRQLVNEGHITSLSVTYAEHKNQKGVQRELLNAAFVAVPANPDAVVLSSKAAKDDGDKKKPYGDVRYADPGYQSDHRARYPIDTADHVRAAWSYINQASNASQYSADELSKIKARIRAAAGKFGIEIAEEKKSIEILAALEAVRKQFGASGNNPVRPGDMIQAIHDASVALGSQCSNITQADTGEDEGANKGFSMNELRALEGLPPITHKSSNLTLVGSPQESAEESAATDTTANMAAVSAAADESAETVAPQALTLKARSLAYLIKQNEEKD